MSQQQTKATQTTSSSTLPTFGGSMSSYQVSAAAASIVELLKMAELYNEMKQYQTDQMLSQLDAQQKAAESAADSQRKAGKEQKNASLANGIATIAGGACQVAGGAATMKMANNNNSAIKNAQSYKDAASNRIQNGSEVTISDCEIVPKIKVGATKEMANGERGIELDDFSTVNAEAKPQFGGTERRINTLKEEMKSGSFDFGDQPINKGEVAVRHGEATMTNAEAAIKLSSKEEAELIIKKADEFIANKSAETARGTPYHYIFNGIGDVAKGTGALIGAGYEKKKADAEADGSLYSNAQNNAQKMVDSAGQQFNADDQAQNGIYQTLGQIMQSVVYQG